MQFFLELSFWFACRLADSWQSYHFFYSTLTFFIVNVFHFVFQIYTLRFQPVCERNATHAPPLVLRKIGLVLAHKSVSLLFSKHYFTLTHASYWKPSRGQLSEWYRSSTSVSVRILHVSCISSILPCCMDRTSKARAWRFPPTAHLQFPNCSKEASALGKHCPNKSWG